MERIILTTGGTGGHIFPALAVAEAVRERFPQCSILFVGGTHGPEATLAQEAGLPFRTLPSQGILGKGLGAVPGLVRLAWGVMRGMALIRSFKPEVVVGFGGYAGFPAVMAGSLLKVPTAVHEQNSIPGMCNRMLGKRVDRIFTSFEGAGDFFDPDRTIMTGNPVRADIVKLGRQDSGKGSGRGKRLLILGGSQGATAINDAVMEILPTLCRDQVDIWHQTGIKDFEKVRARYQDVCPEGRVEPFIADMAAAYEFADLVICRSGATTLAELTIAGKASVLIPFPYAVHGHQLKNARYLEEAGAALVMVQTYMSEVNVAGTITDLLAMPEKLRAMGHSARRLGRPDAAGAIVDEMVALISSEKPCSTGN
ncbi:undecaprenyldiphospho-muramoylpentapeptide beta-N-acetylglucosaminyltransferase [Desulfoplanes sp. PS50]